MTALPPQTDEQWDDLRHRFPSHVSDRYIGFDGLDLLRREVDALRAAGVWCEHDDLSITEAAAAVHGGRPKPHTYAVGVSNTRPSDPATVGLWPPTAGCGRTDPHSDLFCKWCMGHGTLPNPIYVDGVFEGFGPRRSCDHCNGRGLTVPTGDDRNVQEAKP